MPIGPQFHTIVYYSILPNSLWYIIVFCQLGLLDLFDRF